MGTMTVGEVASRLRAFAALGSSPARSMPRSDEAGSLLIPNAGLLGERAEAVSECAARAAEGDWQIKRLRHDYLPEGLLTEAAIHTWVVETYLQDRPADWPLGEPKAGEGHFLRARQDAKDAGVRWTRFDWAEPDPEGGWVPGAWPVPTSGVLADLAKHAEALERQWRWTKTESVLFVLTGRQPYVRPVVGTIQTSRGLNDTLGWYDVFTRVTIEVDPTVTPDQLSAWWREARRAVLGGRRYRPLTERHLRLARFAVSRMSSGSWEQDREAWNRAVSQVEPGWLYTDRRTFRRDAVAAVGRLLHIGYSDA
ncbi:MAG: hypothetical protein M3450_08075 [Actinomycetota bacterium]|nr:hypothetical protein [Actinomycetota bacterium]